MKKMYVPVFGFLWLVVSKCDFGEIGNKRTPVWVVESQLVFAEFCLC